MQHGKITCKNVPKSFIFLFVFLYHSIFMNKIFALRICSSCICSLCIDDSNHRVQINVLFLKI